ncbi:hypothetical protein [Martelella sp. FOR1707]
MDMLNACIAKFAELEKKHVTDEKVWADAIQSFNEALDTENVGRNLESAILETQSWYLPIECKLRLLDKAKNAGCSSFEFWKDYYRYRATYLEPDDPERIFALEMANGKFL